MKILPDPKEITDSDAFSFWCEEVAEYLSDFESEMLKEIAFQHQRKAIRPCITQCLASKEKQHHLETLGWRPMIKPNAENLRQKCLLFVPLPTANIKFICESLHEYTIEGRNLKVRLNRSSLFIDRERELFCYMGEEDKVSERAKREHVVELGFPFLPYSRKFLELELDGDYETRDFRKMRTDFSADNLLIQYSGSVKLASELGFSNTVIPFWNIESGRKTAPGKRRSMATIYSDNSTDRKPSFSTPKLIIHRALDAEKKSVSIRKVGEYIESDLEFKFVEYSVIREMKPIADKLKKDLHIKYPILGNQLINTPDLYWYRNFLQSVALTRRDLDVLITLLPETKDKLRVLGTDLIDSLDNDQYKELIAKKQRPYFDYLWYLDLRELTKSVGQKNLKLLLIQLDTVGEIEDNAKFLIEDRINYFTSICKLHLPMNIECQGYLV